MAKKVTNINAIDELFSEAADEMKDCIRKKYKKQIKELMTEKQLCIEALAGVEDRLTDLKIKIEKELELGF